MTDLAGTVEQLHEIADWWAELEEDLVPGTARRWYERDETEDRRAARRYQDMLDRRAAEREIFWGRIPPGFTASPAVDTVLEVKRQVELNITGLHVLVFAVMSDGQAPQVRFSVSAGARWLADAIPGLSAHPATVEQVASDARHLAWLVRHATGQQEPVVQLKADCPTCACRSLRAFPLREAVRCVNPDCRRVWAGKQQLAWLSRMVGGAVVDVLPMSEAWTA